MEFRVYESLEDLSGKTQDWQKLEEVSNHPFGGISLFEGWYAAGMAENASPLIFTVSDESGLLAVLPAYSEPRAIRLAGDSFWDYQDILCCDESAAEFLLTKVLEWLKAKHPSRPLKMVKIAETGVLYQLLQKGDFNKAERNSGHCPFVKIAPGLNGYLKSLNRKRRGDMRQALNRFTKKVEDFQTTILREDQITDALIEDAISFHRKHFNREGKNAADCIDIENFLKVVAKGDSPKLHFSTMDIEGERVAIDFGFVTKNTYHGYLMTFDQKYSFLRPGKCLILQRIDEWVEKDRIETLDLLLGGESYKRYYTTGDKYEVLRMTVFPSSLSGKMKAGLMKLFYHWRSILAKTYRKWRPAGK